MENFAEVDPAGTVTLPGTVADALLLESVTTAPPEGAGAATVTVFAVVVLPPAVEVGESATAESTGGVSVRIAVLLTPP